MIKIHNAQHLFDNIGTIDEIRIDLSTRNPQEIAEVIAFFEENKDKYGSLNTEFSKYGRLYLKTTSQTQRKAFFEDVFSSKPPLPLTKVDDIFSEDSLCHVPEEINLIYDEGKLNQTNISSLIQTCKQQLALSNSHQSDEYLIRVAVIDTGIDYTHSKLKYKFDLSQLGKNFVNEFRQGVEPLSEDNPLDQKGHGTHVAGIIIKEEPDIQIYSLKCLDNIGKGKARYVLEALEWCKNHQVDVINLSLGGYEYDSLCEIAISNLPPNMIVVAAAGNGAVGVSYPAHYPKVISVTSVNEQLEHSMFSRVWHSVDISAQGENIASTYPFETYAVLSGTSMATAFTTSVIASALTTLKRGNKLWTHSEIEQILKESSILPATSLIEKLVHSLGLPSHEEGKRWIYGSGIVDKNNFLNRIKKEYF